MQSQVDTEVPDADSMASPQVRRLTTAWYPSTMETGSELPREYSSDGTGWAPTRTLEGAVWGLNSSHLDPLGFYDLQNVTRGIRTSGTKQDHLTSSARQEKMAAALWTVS